MIIQTKTQDPAVIDKLIDRLKKEKEGAISSLVSLKGMQCTDFKTGNKRPELDSAKGRQENYDIFVHDLKSQLIHSDKRYLSISRIPTEDFEYYSKLLSELGVEVEKVVTWKWADSDGHHSLDGTPMHTDGNPMGIVNGLPVTHMKVCFQKNGESKIIDFSMYDNDSNKDIKDNQNFPEPAEM